MYMYIYIYQLYYLCRCCDCESVVPVVKCINTFVCRQL